MRAGAIKPYLSGDVTDHMIDFSIPEVVNKTTKGLPADTFIEICRAFVIARNGGTLNAKQIEMAIKADMFLAACAKTGLDALIDEVTGYQYERAHDALTVKLNEVTSIGV